MLRIDVKSSRELQALILSVRQADKDVQKEIRQRTKPMIQAEWKKALAENAMTRVESIALVDSARVAVSNQNVKLKSGGLARKLSGGARVFEISKQAEFGAALKTIRYQGRRGSKSFPVERTAGGQFRYENKKGYVVYPAAAEIIPRLASLWVQTAVRTFHEALEKR
jgi:hypothetical protein